MVLELVSPNELGRALGIDAGSRPLPVTARSLTPAEVRAPAWREIGWMAAVYVLFGIACFAVIELASTNPTLVVRLPIVAGAAALILLVIAWRKLSRHSGYRDPGIIVEVDEEAVTVAWPEGRDILPYDQVVVQRILARTPRNSVYFDGIVLETAQGPLQLGDPAFAGGNVAAGAILRKLDELETAPARAA
ncbi:hypothetical protein RCO27_14920 [Sphingosinicella sp. LHD-64]|uniref:hypothetical protein n=1 Tax=Sphingosinicella sp. LHD-64 TaxID=3072139 RepID=UPI00280EA141|nr:hypothetical protein [Sphingosinicella sp. LHD-64]MDQ8757521.1 hypothetical protein [Sphingosinicella sp. LHD-64]